VYRTDSAGCDLSSVRRCADVFGYSEFLECGIEPRVFHRGTLWVISVKCHAVIECGRTGEGVLCFVFCGRDIGGVWFWLLSLVAVECDAAVGSFADNPRVYWYWGELHGVGDLRPYVLVQFFPMILLVILFVFGRPVFGDNRGYWWLLASYILAKLAEHFDGLIAQWTDGVMAGHALKHVLAAMGLWFLLRCFAQRVRVWGVGHG
jgi:hypothetical protein